MESNDGTTMTVNVSEGQRPREGLQGLDALVRRLAARGSTPPTTTRTATRMPPTSCVGHVGEGAGRRSRRPRAARPTAALDDGDAIAAQAVHNRTTPEVDEDDEATDEDEAVEEDESADDDESLDDEDELGDEGRRGRASTRTSSRTSTDVEETDDF